MTHRLAGIISALVLALTLGPATASAGGIEYDGQKAHKAHKYQTQKSIQGEIAATKLVDVTHRGQTESHVVALVRTDQGKLVAVDLGPQRDLRAATPMGAQIQARGQMVRVGDRNTLLAERAQIEGRMVRIEQPVQMRQQRTQQQMQSQRTLRGEVLRQKLVSVRGEPIRHRVVLLETDRGDRFIVDLGPSRDLRQAQIRPGKQLTVRATPTRVGQQRVLKADRLRVEGRTYRIDRAQI